MSFGICPPPRRPIPAPSSWLPDPSDVTILSLPPGSCTTYRESSTIRSSHLITLRLEPCRRRSCSSPTGAQLASRARQWSKLSDPAVPVPRILEGCAMAGPSPCPSCNLPAVCASPSRNIMTCGWLGTMEIGLHQRHHRCVDPTDLYAELRTPSAGICAEAARVTTWPSCALRHQYGGDPPLRLITDARWVGSQKHIDFGRARRCRIDIWLQDDVLVQCLLHIECPNCRFLYSCYCDL